MENEGHPVDQGRKGYVKSLPTFYGMGEEDVSLHKVKATPNLGLKAWYSLK
jgi:hypothetical protein